MWYLRLGTHFSSKKQDVDAYSGVTLVTQETWVLETKSFFTNRLDATWSILTTKPWGMPRKALSATKKTQLQQGEHDHLMQQPMIIYKQEQDKPGKKAGLWTICRDLEKEFQCEKGWKITLNHNTLQNLVKGGRSRSEENAVRGWLMKEEAKEVIDYTIEIAEWGHGLSHRRLKEQVDEILCARLGSTFPALGIGSHWTQCFIEKHSDQLHVYAACPLDTACGQAVNKHANHGYYNIIHGGTGPVVG